ncbi:DNA polymerase IV [Acidobacteriota bacterium]
MYNHEVIQQHYIVHVDMDAFYAAIEQRDRPSLLGKPVVVGADPKEGRGRGVVSTCSYEAREYGIHSAMPISIAYRKCPHAIYLPVNMKKYVQESRDIFETLEQFTPDIETVSIDEAFLDITASYHLFGTPKETCIKIKTAIKNKTGLTASLGMAPNKMTAKIASDLEKPDGLVIVNQEGLLNFLHRLPVEKLWGVGKRTHESFKEIGIHTIGDLARQDLKQLIHQYGKAGEHAWKLANGIDPRKVSVEGIVKSVSNEHTFSEDETESKKILDTLMYLSEKVSRRLRKKELQGRTVTLKIRFADFKTFTRAETLERPTNFVEDIYACVAQQAKKFQLERKPIRLLGVRVSNLREADSQPGLFDDTADLTEKKERLHQAMDTIKDKFGEKVIKRR